MKTVFTDISKVAHLWANKVQDTARNSGNFYFNGNEIYSYGSHFCIAKHVINNAGESAVLFTERTYSNTTAKHISVVKQACRHLKVIYCYNPHNYHSDNFSQWQKEIESIASNLTRAKKPEIYLNKIDSVKHRINEYAAYFSLTIPDGLIAAMEITDKGKYSAYVDIKEKLRIESEKKAQKELQKRHNDELKKWLNLETNRLYVHGGLDYLRINKGRIETTQAVEIPLELGKRLYTCIKDNTLEVGQKVLDYSVQSIGQEIKIGCHTFKKSYLLQFGSKL